MTPIRHKLSNHVTINKDSITVDGIPLLVEADSVIITGYDNPREVTKVMLTLIPDEITINQLGNAPDEEGDDEGVAKTVGYVEIKPDFTEIRAFLTGFAELINKH